MVSYDFILSLYLGVPGLYRGLNACLLKVIPSMAIAFTIHESLRNLLKFDL